MKTIITVALKQNALFIPSSALSKQETGLSPIVTSFVTDIAKIGYGIDSPLIAILNNCDPSWIETLHRTFYKVMGVKGNWNPLIRNWDQTMTSSYLTGYFESVFNEGYKVLPCGHVFPAASFLPLEYNGCPFCGTPYIFEKLPLKGQNKQLKKLAYWDEQTAMQYAQQLLAAKVPLAADGLADLTALLTNFPIPEVNITIKETLVKVTDMLIENGQPAKAAALFKTPTDILRYLWFKNTGYLQLVKVKTLMGRLKVISPKFTEEYKKKYQLKYNREACRRVAQWMNDLPLTTTAVCEAMHPHREIWVRMIRALRFAEYAKRPGFGKLAGIMDCFYNQDYTVLQGEINAARQAYNAEVTLAKLQQRPGLFARSLFSNMLWFGAAPVCESFAAIAHQLPSRLLLTLQMYAAYYFDKNTVRIVKPLEGNPKKIPAHPLVSLYADEHIKEMEDAVSNLCAAELMKRFTANTGDSFGMYIAPELYKMPLPIGDRSSNLQQVNAVPAGTRFPVLSEEIILFMHWGEGMPAQHLDMDLSCAILGEKMTLICNYTMLNQVGCTHSGDIQRIPDEVGATEYIKVNVEVLQRVKAEYVVFTCNAFTAGELSPTLKVGWLDSATRIKPGKYGIVYDPSCVQQMVHITQPLKKGLVMGILDVHKREMIWAELPFDGQTINSLNIAQVRALVRKLSHKMTIGHLLEIKAKAQDLYITDQAEHADEVYTKEWGYNIAAVSALLPD